MGSPGQAPTAVYVTAWTGYLEVFRLVKLELSPWTEGTEGMDEQARRDSLLASIESAWEMVARAEAIGSDYLARSHRARIVSMTRALRKMEGES